MTPAQPSLFDAPPRVAPPRERWPGMSEAMALVLASPTEGRYRLVPCEGIAAWMTGPMRSLEIEGRVRAVEMRCDQRVMLVEVMR